ncbi:MAG: 16S rRNA (adenine(1518)-N(6)/adenine(1519)-N(6))-dimethyltransferase RsmA [bacterium]
MHLHPLKRFGQNFLTDQNVIKKIIAEFAPKMEDTVIEIGPGRAALTEYLLKMVNNFYAVEIDKKVAAELKESFPGLNLIVADFLKTNLHEIHSGSQHPIRVIGNIPYNITSSILFKLIEDRGIIDDAILMVQYEVAKRMTAKRKSKDYGILAVILNHFADVQLCFKVSRNVFYPKPNVDSAIIHLKFKNDEDKELDNNLFIQLVKTSFGKRRKTLKNSLRNSIFDSNFLNDFDIDLNLRAEHLDIKDFINLTKFFQVHR